MNKEKRQRAPRIKPTVKRLIAEEATRYPNKPRLALAIDLRDSIGRMGEISPSEETLVKMISGARRNKDDLLDIPWHLGTLEDNPLSPEAIRHVLLLQGWVKTNNEQPLTIRRVLWASRLYPVVCHKKIKEQDLQNLWCISGGYAWYERICKISDTDFDTTVLDEAVIGLREWRDALFSLIAPAELKEGHCSPELFAWLLNKTKDDPEQRSKLYEILHIPTEKEGGK